MERRYSTTRLSRRDRYLFDRATVGDWAKIVDTYTGEDRGLKITASGDTALHMAVRFGKTEHVRKMVRKIGENEAFEILSLQNNTGNTALHIAAAIGNVAICCCIANRDRRLLALPNQTGSTPLYVSVAYGNGEAFFHLDFLVRQSRVESGQAINYSLYTQQHGRTILHVAVFREYFGLAIQIVEYYPDLVNFVDKLGWSPLHTLATKFAAFRSTSFVGLIDRTLLSWINVQELVDKEKKKPLIYHQLFGTQGDYYVNPRDIQTNIPTQNTFNRGNGERLRKCCLTLFSVLFETILYAVKTFLQIAGIGWLDIHHFFQCCSHKIKNLRKKETRWILAYLLSECLVFYSTMYMNDPYSCPNSQTNIPSGDSDPPPNESSETKKLETPFLLAARTGVTEVVQLILDKYPVAAFDFDSELKNAAMLAAERNRVGLYKFLLHKYPKVMERMMVQLDKQGNNVMHHCATFRPQIVLIYTPEPATLLRSKYSWFKFVKTKMPPNFLHLHNRAGLTPEEVFMKTHKELIESGSEWLVKSSETCSVVAALIATVAFATSAVNTPTGGSIFLFDLYSIFALLALSFSLVSLLYFIAIRTSSFRVRDFAETLPMKLFMGLLFLLISMVCIFTSFCFVHYSKLHSDTMRHIAVPIYILAGIRLLSLAASQLPFYHGAFFQLTFREPI